MTKAKKPDLGKIIDRLARLHSDALALTYVGEGIGVEHDAELGGAIQRIASRFRRKINKTVDELDQLAR